MREAREILADLVATCLTSEQQLLVMELVAGGDVT
jgi:hypothetical protein